MSTKRPTLHGALLLEQIRTLGRIGLDAETGGRTRLALTDADKAGRDQLVKWMRDLQLEVRIDRIGNIFGILPAATPAGNAQPLMMGSHTDDDALLQGAQVLLKVVARRVCGDH